MNEPTIAASPEQPRILVVDDEADIAEGVKFCLEQEGYEVKTACNGWEALGAIRAWAPNLVLLDVMLPNENGYRVSRMAKEDAERGIAQSVKVVLVTARRLDDADRERTFADFSRCDRVVYKPFDLDLLLGVVAELVGSATPVTA
jgi:CheY-like chemotaxis protein